MQLMRRFIGFGPLIMNYRVGGILWRFTGAVWGLSWPGKGAFSAATNYAAAGVREGRQIPLVVLHCA